MAYATLGVKGAMHCLQAKPYKYTCYSCQAAGTSELANRLFHVLGKNYFMLHKILCGFITMHSPFKGGPINIANNLRFAKVIVYTSLPGNQDI